VAGNDRSNAAARRLGEIATVGLIWQRKNSENRRRGSATASSEESDYKAMRNASRKKEESTWTIGGSFHANGHCKWREVGSRVCCLQNWVAQQTSRRRSPQPAHSRPNSQVPYLERTRRESTNRGFLQTTSSQRLYGRCSVGSQSRRPYSCLALAFARTS
jgi:hypothetical protein